MLKVLVLHSSDELVAHMVVDPDSTHTQREHTEGVLVVVSHRPTADCMKRETVFKLPVPALLFQKIAGSAV